MSWIFRRPFDFGARARRWRSATLPIVLEFIASGGITFGGSASVAVTLDHVASGGMTFGGSADVAFTHSHPGCLRAVGQWHLNESGWNGTPGEVIDSSGEGNHGQAVDGANTIADGKLGRCGSFDGINDHVNCGSQVAQTSRRTYSWWQWIAANGGSNFPHPLSHGGYTFGIRAIWRDDGDDRLDFQITCGDDSTPTIVLESQAIEPVQEWHHFVVTYDGSIGKLYRDAVLQDTKSTTKGDIKFAPADFLIAGGQFTWNGKIDDVCVFDRELTQDEVTFLYNSGLGTEVLPSQPAFGGLTFGGSADVSFTVTPPIGGDIAFGGAAEIAFTKAVVGSGGIVFGGRAYIGDVIGSKFWLNGPGFELGDLLRAQQVDYDKDHNPIGVYSIDAEVVEIRSGQKMVLEIKSGKEYLTNALKGQIEFVRLGNRTDANRQGSVMIQSQPACVAVMDAVDDFSKWGTLATYKGVFGKLDWINDPDFGQLSGWGAFIPNLYAKGNVILGPYSSIQWANVAGSGKPENNATVGATWGSNLTGIPIRFAEAPTGSGLYICASYLGYYNGSAWKTYMDSSGNFYLGGTSGALQWNGVSLTLSTVGNLSGAQGKAALTGGEIILYGSNDGGSSYVLTGYVAGERSGGGINYLNIAADEYLRMRGGGISYWNLTLWGGDIEIRGSKTYLKRYDTGADTIVIDHISGDASGLNASYVNGKMASEIASAGNSSGATNPTLKRSVSLNGVTFDVACYN